MRLVRHLLAQRQLAALMCVVTLFLKLVVPTGYMIGSDHGRIAITICSGTSPTTLMMDMPGMHGDMPGVGVIGGADHGKSKDHGKSEMPCAFAGLSAAMMGTVDPIQLAALIAFVMAIGTAGLILPTPSPPSHLRPPLRGPPASL